MNCAPTCEREILKPISTPNILYHNDRDSSFTDVGMESGTALSEDGQEQAGMGVSGIHSEPANQ